MKKKELQLHPNYIIGFFFALFLGFATLVCIEYLGSGEWWNPYMGRYYTSILGEDWKHYQSVGGMVKSHYYYGFIFSFVYFITILFFLKFNVKILDTTTTSEKDLCESKKVSKSTKYVYLVAQVKKPELILKTIKKLDVDTKQLAKISLKKRLYIGKINKIEKYNKAKIQKFIEKMEIEIGKVAIEDIESRLSHEIFLEDKAVAEIERIKQQGKLDIVFREIKMFDSYGEAIISRKKMIG